MKSRECVGRNPLILSVYFHVFCLRMSFVSIRLVVMTQNVRKGRKTREEDKVQQAYKKKRRRKSPRNTVSPCCVYVLTGRYHCAQSKSPSQRQLGYLYTDQHRRSRETPSSRTMMLINWPYHPAESISVSAWFYCQRVWCPLCRRWKTEVV